jgi:divalent metal cation (Fe/Co/Zn/Cd) transporter
MPAGRERHNAPRLHGRWRLLARGVWVTVVVCTVGVCFASLPAYLAQLHTPCTGSACSFQQLTLDQVGALNGLGLSLSAYAAYTVAIALANVVVCLLVSAVIVLRQPEDRMAFIVALMLVTLGPLMMSESMSASFSPWQAPNQYLSGFCVALLLLVFALFPTGRFVPQWMRWPMVVIGITTVFPTPLSTLKFQAANLGFLVFLVEAALLVGIQIYRYQQVSSPLQQQQTKWVVFGFSVMIACWVIAFASYLLFPVLAVTGSLYLPAIIAIQCVTLLTIPLAFGVAMLRYRLWDVDTLINRALVYGSLTLTLTGVYGGLVIGLQALLRGLTRQDNALAIVISTLAIVVLVQPVRRRLQALIDRRFYRRKYDAAKTLAAFSATLRHEVDLDQLRVQVLVVVQETLQPSSASLWLRPSRRRDDGVTYVQLSSERTGSH